MFSKVGFQEISNFNWMLTLKTRKWNAALTVSQAPKPILSVPEMNPVNIHGPVVQNPVRLTQG